MKASARPRQFQSRVSSGDKEILLWCEALVSAADTEPMRGTLGEALAATETADPAWRASLQRIIL